MNSWCFTFGYGHCCPNRFVVIKAKSGEEARKKMFELFGDKWSFQYNNDKESRQIFSKHCIREISLEEAVDKYKEWLQGV